MTAANNIDLELIVAELDQITDEDLGRFVGGPGVW
jgi:hypothetical protein